MKISIIDRYLCSKIYYSPEDNSLLYPTTMENSTCELVKKYGDCEADDIPLKMLDALNLKISKNQQILQGMKNATSLLRLLFRNRLTFFR